MSYQQYRTDAIVLKSIPRGEADRTLVLYTRGFGLVYARAAAVRREYSRLRYALQDLSLSNVGLVRGKRGWRVVGATLSGSCPPAPDARAACARVAGLLVRLVHGEEAHEHLYAILASAHAAFHESPAEHINALEVLGAARVLHALGYFAPHEHHQKLFENTSCEPVVCEQAESVRRELTRAVNTSLAETQLAA